MALVCARQRAPRRRRRSVQEFTLPGPAETTPPGSSLPDPNGKTPLRHSCPGTRPLVKYLPQRPDRRDVRRCAHGRRGRNSRITVLGPSAWWERSTNSTDTHLQDPFGMAWDAANSELVEVDGNDNVPSGAADDLRVPELLHGLELGRAGERQVGRAARSIRIRPTNCNNGTRRAEGPSVPVRRGRADQRHPSRSPRTSRTTRRSTVPKPACYEIALYDSNGNALSNGIIVLRRRRTAPALACNATDVECPTSSTAPAAYPVTGLYWLSSTKLLVLSSNKPNKDVRVQRHLHLRRRAYELQRSRATGVRTASSTHGCVPSAVPNGPSRRTSCNLPSIEPFAAAFKP